MSNQQLLEQAGVQIRGLADGAGIRPIAMAIDLAGVGSEMLPSLLAHELVAGHAAMMRLISKLDLYLDQIAADRPAEEQDRACRQAVQLSSAAARLTERYRLGLMSLARLDGWQAAEARRRKAAAADPADLDDDDPFDGGPGGGPGGGGRRQSPAKALAELRALNKSMAAMLNGASGNAAKPNGNGTHLEAPANRGRLKHGNPSGDFLAAPRCGARTRAACACRQPAMANGRCRFHGGKSTGARTAAGLARCRTATLRHGHRTAEIIELKSAAASSSRALEALTRAAHVSAQHRSEQPTPCPATVAPPVGATGRSPASPNPQPVQTTEPRYFLTTGDLPVAPTSPRSDQPTPCPARHPLPRRRSAAG